jgi:hypothetical protein
MLKQHAVRTYVVIAACTATSIVSTGCRAMPGMGMFARGGPSAEALAGNGPSATYPVPPSHLATPEAIASIAGGTGRAQTPSSADSETAQVAGIEISPGYALSAGADPAKAMNASAAQANGFLGSPGAPMTSPPTFASAPNADLSPTGNASPNAPPSGYAFGSKALTPKSGPAYASNLSTNAPAESTTAFAPPAGPLMPPSTDVAELPAADYTAPPGGGGFTLPSDGPAMASITPPQTAQPKRSAWTPTPDQPDDSASAPSFSTARASSDSSPTSFPGTFGNPAPSSGYSTTGTSGGYMPGSTGSAAAYPTGDTTPTTNGSFYR